MSRPVASARWKLSPGVYGYTLPDNLPKGVPWFIAEDSGSVWVAGDSALIAKASTSDLTQWTLLNSGIPSDVSIDWLAFVNSHVIFAAGGDGTIYTTSNGGVSWTVSFSDPQLTQFIDIIKFFDSHHGVACGDGSGGSGLMAFLETTDGGLTWRNNNTFQIVGETNYDLVSYAAPSSVFMSGYWNFPNGQSYRGVLSSTDLGTTWRFATVGSGSFEDSTLVTQGVAFASNLVGLACRADSTFWSTSDGGITWQQVGQKAGTFFFCADFVGGATTAMCGGYRQASLAEVDLSSSTYSVQREDTSVTALKNISFTYVDFPTTERGYMICGGQLRTFYATESPTSVKADPGMPEHYSLGQNYPNPFNPTTIIQYAVPRREYVVLSVFNILGEKVADLVNGLREAGAHTVSFNASDLSSGLYFYRIQAGSFVETKKLVVVK
ncbi:MAG TPA: T9SS type A sorting domain-containing protein [Bacteroidota bacterium]|nr:T9SS type A sorting domain-containing protein [Bacteroidota bacterium]